MEIIKENNKKALSRAVQILWNGGVIICPTDTVYGFLADAANKKAVEKIFKLKKRLRSKPLPVFVRDFKMAEKLAEISKEQEKILTLQRGSGQTKYWPGKYTFILKSKQIEARPLSDLVIGKDGTIALRIPKYKFLNDLLKKINRPIAQTSVNISGKSPLTKIGDIISQFARTGLPILIINTGDLPKNRPSVIIDLTKDKNKILRK